MAAVVTPTMMSSRRRIVPPPMKPTPVRITSGSRIRSFITKELEARPAVGARKLTSIIATAAAKATSTVVSIAEVLPCSLRVKPISRPTRTVRAAGSQVELNGVMFDGCRESDGTMLDAKGPGYEGPMRGPDARMENYTGSQGIMTQAKAQWEAAAGRQIEWHFAAQSVADYFRQKFSDNGWSNITVLYTPYSGGK